MLSIEIDVFYCWLSTYKRVPLSINLQSRYCGIKLVSDLLLYAIYVKWTLQRHIAHRTLFVLAHWLGKISNLKIIYLEIIIQSLAQNDLRCKNAYYQFKKNIQKYMISEKMSNRSFHANEMYEFLCQWMIFLELFLMSNDVDFLYQCMPS